MEKFNTQTSPESTATLRAKIVVDKMEAQGIDLASLSEEGAIKLLSDPENNKKFRFPGVTNEDVIAKLRLMGYIKPVEQPKEKPAPVETVVVSNRVQLKGISEVEDEDLREMLEQNHFFEELAGNIFKNDQDLETVYAQAMALEKGNSMETREYYLAFAGLVKGGVAEIESDLESLAVRLRSFKEKLAALPPQEAARVEKMKKVATIVERAIIHAVTTVAWYGEGISIESTSQFDDVKRGVDGVLQIRRESDDDTFLALGIDATFRGLLSEEYKIKFSGILESIYKGYKTRIKYFKNHQGELMEEFAAPKVVLYFDNKDVKSLVNLVKNSGDAEAIKEFKANPQRVATMNQILVQCQILGEFAKECNNSISAQYDEFIDAINRLGKKDPEIQAMIDASKENEVTHHMRHLVKEFKLLHYQQAA